MRKVLRNLLNWLDKRAAKKELKRVKSSNNAIEEPFKKFVSVLIDNNYLDLNEDCVLTHIWYRKKDMSFCIERGGKNISYFKLQDIKEEN